MGIFSSIKHAIFGEAKAATVVEDAEASVPASQTASASVSAVEASAAEPAQAIDVAAILDAAVKASGEKLDWKHSIVDLLKALKIDSSVAARKELAAELGFSGSSSDSATMNVWLHKAVIRKLSENGGHVPADLLD